MCKYSRCQALRLLKATSLSPIIRVAKKTNKCPLRHYNVATRNLRWLQTHLASLKGEIALMLSCSTSHQCHQMGASGPQPWGWAVHSGSTDICLAICPQSVVILLIARRDTCKKEKQDRKKHACIVFSSDSLQKSSFLYNFFLKSLKSK